MTNTAMEREILILRNRIFGLFFWQNAMTVEERQELNDKVDDLIADTFTSQLKQIREEIEQRFYGANNPKVKDILELITSHIEKNEEEKKSE